MILAHHLILTGYGHWLPNDPRGSMSHEVRSRPLRGLGEHHYGRKPVQPSRPELREFHQKAKEPLRFAVRWFDEPERQVLIQAAGQVVQEKRLTCYAAAVLDNHLHLLIRRHSMQGQEIVRLFKDRLAAGLHETALFHPEHPVFSEDSCVIFKNDRIAIRTCIAYILDNFAKHKLPVEIYPFVQDYDGWPHRD